MWVEMKVRGLALDPVSNMPIIILRDEEEKRSLPIWVGIFEANAIALELEKIATQRPMTHDLIKNVLEAVEAKVEKIVVNDLRENTFFALIHLRMGRRRSRSTRGPPMPSRWLSGPAHRSSSTTTSCAAPRPSRPRRRKPTTRRS